MAVSRQPVHTLLNAWQRYMHVNPWHFNQVSGKGTQAPLSRPGQLVYVAPDWDTLTTGILNALALAVPYLGTFHRPVYAFEDIRLDGWPGSYGAQLRTKYSHVQAIGKRGTALLEAAAAIVYSDVGGDGINNVATITASVPSGTLASEIQVFFKQSDSLSTITADERWQIEPLTVSVTGTTATITGHRSLFANPALWRRPFNSPNYNRSSINHGDTTDAADFITEVDVYRIFPDETDAVTFLSTPTPNCGNCQYHETVGRAYVYNGERGLVKVCSDCTACTGYPRYVRLHYLAGLPLDPMTGLPNPTAETAFIQLANAEMPWQISDFSEEMLRTWLHDWEITPQGELPPELVNNPFGVRRGQVAAFRKLSTLARPVGGALVGGRF